jgi:ribonuclease HIII
MYNLYMTPIQEQLLSRLRKFAVDHSLQLLSERPIDYGVQVIIAEEAREIPVNIYSTGRVVVGGKESALRTLLKEWAASHQTGKSASPGRVQVAHIGVDEAGKGAA